MLRLLVKADLERGLHRAVAHAPGQARRAKCPYDLNIGLGFLVLLGGFRLAQQARDDAGRGLRNRPERMPEQQAEQRQELTGHRQCPERSFRFVNPAGIHSDREIVIEDAREDWVASELLAQFVTPRFELQEVGVLDLDLLICTDGGASPLLRYSAARIAFTS